MASSNSSRRSLVVSLVLTLAISFGALFATLGAGWSPKLGLDLAGGLSVVYKPATHASLSDLQEVTSVLTNRVNGLGVSGAQVNLQGRDVVVSVPGVTNARQVLKAIGQTAQLLFRPVVCYATEPSAKAVAVAPGKLPSCGSGYYTSPTNLGIVVAPNTANGYTGPNNIADDPAFTNIKSPSPQNDLKNDYVILPVLGQTGIRYVLGPAELTGKAIKSALAQENQAGAWVVNYTLTSAGSPQWDKVAEANFHGLLAIELDGVVQSAPLIQPTQSSFTSFGGTGEISGSFTETSAKNLALAMQFGSLPVRLVPLTTETVSPTLGHSALVAGLGAGLAGLALVLLYVILYYRALGLVILLGLGLTGALLWAIISSLGHTALAPSFDLAGVTGLIVSIGITVDSYIVYFERLKDESRAGRTVRTSVDRGFRSAWRTVLAADFVSFLAALLLYLIAVGDVRGFAFFLGLSTILDVLVTWYFTRPIVILLGRRSGAGNSAMSIAAGMGSGAADE